MWKTTLATGLLLMGTAALVFWSPGKGRAANPGTVTYRYDSLGRIVQDVYPANSAAYNYDNAGNRTSAALN